MHPRHRLAALALAALGGLAAAAPASADLRLTAPAGPVGVGDLAGAPGSRAIVTVRGRRDPGDPTTIAITLAPMISFGSGNLVGGFLVRTITVADATRSFSVRITRGDLRAAGACQDVGCTTTAPGDAWRPDPFRIRAASPTGVGETFAPGGIAFPVVSDSTDVGTASARIGDGRGGFAELNASPEGGGPNFVAALRPLPVLGAGGLLGGWSLAGVRVDGTAATQALGAGKGFRQTHAAGTGGRIAIVQTYALRRPAADGVHLVRHLRFLRDGGGTVQLDDAYRNPSGSRRVVAATYLVGGLLADSAVWRLSWLGGRPQTSGFRTSLPRPRGGGTIVVHREAALDGEANRGWAAFRERPLATRFASAAYANGQLLVTFRLVLSPHATGHVHLAAGATQDTASALARARAAFR